VRVRWTAGKPKCPCPPKSSRSVPFENLRRTQAACPKEKQDGWFRDSSDSYPDMLRDYGGKIGRAQRPGAEDL